MDNLLWNKILEFDLDRPFSEYGFSTRLADENYWTKNFTAKAILEYKKFMYLAGTSDFMVSPSEIIDTVWHQHLIYTQSYNDFCQIIGKNIQHIPSTHNKVDFEKFRQAKERTNRLYSETFGQQPKEIWEYSGMYESLELGKAKWKIRSFILIGIFAFVLLIIPFYSLLKPIYIQIENPSFIQGIIALTILVFLFLEIYNRAYLLNIVRNFKEFSFIHDLTPQELIYLKKQNLKEVVHGTINQMIEEKKLIVESSHYIEKTGVENPSSLEEYQVYEVCDLHGNTPYLYLVLTLIRKPVFVNISGSMNAFKKYFIKSKKFARLFYTNFFVLGTFLMIVLIRLLTGLMRDKPVTYISLTVIILSLIIAFFLFRLTKYFTSNTIPTYYKNQIVPLSQSENDLQWQ